MRTRRPPRSPATAAARSSPSRCGPTCSRRCSTQGRSSPAIVVAGDDRAARDLAAALRAWLEPRDGPLLPEPGRHLRVAPGAAAAPRRAADRRARRAARRAGLGAPPVVVVSAVALSEKVPDPALRPHGFALRTGRAARPRRDRPGPGRRRLRARRAGRGPRPVRDPRRPARPVPGHRGPGRPGRPVRR